MVFVLGKAVSLSALGDAGSLSVCMYVCGTHDEYTGHSDETTLQPGESITQPGESLGPSGESLELPPPLCMRHHTP